MNTTSMRSPSCTAGTVNWMSVAAAAVSTCEPTRWPLSMSSMWAPTPAPKLVPARTVTTEVAAWPGALKRMAAFQGTRVFVL